MKHFKTIALALLLLPLEAMAQFAWYGADGEARVKTDLGIGNDTDGEWYSIGDFFDGGKSYVTIFDSGGPMPTDEDVQAYGGIKGQIKLDYGTASYSLAALDSSPLEWMPGNMWNATPPHGVAWPLATRATTRSSLS